MTGDVAPAMLDSHVHLWDLAVRDQAWIPAGSPIRRSFDVRDLRSALAGTPVDGVILVQVINDADETTDLISYARNADIIHGVVGWRRRAFRPGIHGRPTRHPAPGPGRGGPGGLAAIARGPAQPGGTRRR